jgi:hypothetical protein
VERGYLVLPIARQSIMSGHVADAEAQFAEAADIGVRFGDADLINLARQGRGVCSSSAARSSVALPCWMK